MSDVIPEAETEDYSSYLKEIIQNLMAVKQTLKRGKARKANRKEVNNLQSAIKALRYLEKKNNKAVDKLLLNGSDDLLNENKDFGSDDIRNFFYNLRRYDED